MKPEERESTLDPCVSIARISPSRGRTDLVRKVSYHWKFGSQFHHVAAGDTQRTIQNASMATWGLGLSATNRVQAFHRLSRDNRKAGQNAFVVDTSRKPRADRSLKSLRPTFLLKHTAARIDPRPNYLYRGGLANSVRHPAVVPPAVVVTPDLPPVAHRSIVGQLPQEPDIEIRIP